MFIALTPVGGRSIAISVYVCLSVFSDTPCLPSNGEDLVHTDLLGMMFFAPLPTCVQIH